MEDWRSNAPIKVMRGRRSAYWPRGADRGTRRQRAQKLASNHIDLIFGWEHRCAAWRHKNKMTSHYKLLLFLAAAARPVAACRFIAYCGNRTVDARKLLLDGENNLLALATSRPLLPALSLSRHYDEAQVPLRNVEKNLDGYGVSW